MIKEDEKRFMKEIYKIRNKHKVPRQVIDEIDIDYKRCWYLLEKWSSKGYYEYGTCLDCGWLLEEGKKKAREWIKELEEEDE